MSDKTKLAVVTRAVEQVNKKHFSEEPVKQMETKSILKQEIEENGAIQVERISEKMYGSTPEIKEEFDAKGKIPYGEGRGKATERTDDRKNLKNSI